MPPHERTIEEVREIAMGGMGLRASLGPQFLRFYESDLCMQLINAAVEYFGCWASLKDLTDAGLVNRHQMVTLEAERAAKERSLAESYNLVIMSESNYR